MAKRSLSKAAKARLIRDIDPPDEIIPYDPEIANAIFTRVRKDQEELRHFLQNARLRLYRSAIAWFPAEVKAVVTQTAGRAGAFYEFPEAQELYAKADAEWNKATGLPPPTTLKNWQVIATRAYGRAVEEAMIRRDEAVDAVVAYFRLEAQPGKAERGRAALPKTSVERGRRNKGGRPEIWDALRRLIEDHPGDTDAEIAKRYHRKYKVLGSGRLAEVTAKKVKEVRANSLKKFRRERNHS